MTLRQRWTYARLLWRAYTGKRQTPTTTHALGPDYTWKRK